MTRSRSLLSRLAPAALALAIAPALAPTAAAETFVVAAAGLTFTPPNIVIQLGDTVRWEHFSDDHTTTEGFLGTPGGAWDAPLDPANPVFEITFDAAFLAANPRPGNTYEYYCDLHLLAAMAGTIRVIDEPGLPYCFGQGCACFNFDLDAGCANSTSSGAGLSGSGTASVSSDDLVLTTTGLPPNQFGLVFMGPEGVNIPFGAGKLCIGTGSSSFFRYPIFNAGPAGEATLGPGIAAFAAGDFPLAGQITPGSTWFYQAWYRDPNGPCFGLVFNLSNGYEVAFTP